MGDQMAEMGAKFAVSAAVEVFKECLKGIKGVSAWVGSYAGRHDPLDRAAKDYVNQFAERYNVMRVLGMRKPMPLTDIYIRVNILEKVTARQWKRLEELEKDFDRDRRGFGVPKESRTGIDIANEFQKFIVLGRPGSGKTTYLKYIGLQAFNGRLGAKLIPVFVSLKDFADSGQSLIGYVLRQFDICRFPKDEEFVERLLEEGRCILLFDGLDEVGKNESNEVIREVRDFSDKYSGNRIVLSCRIAAYNWQFEKFADTELADFSDEQIKNFIDSWFGENSKKAISCWLKLRENPPIRELASVPLLLTLLCITFDENMEFPRNKAELYKDFVDVVLRKWDASKSIERNEVYKGLSKRRKEVMFGQIAAKTFNEDQFFIPHRTLEKCIADFIENLPEADQKTLEPDSEAVLRAIEAQHGLLVERAKGIYSFSHLTFQEYFTASYIVDNVREGTLEELVKGHLTDEKWKEVFLITTGMLGKADEFLLMIKRQTDAFIADIRLAEFLKDVQASVAGKDKSFLPSSSRALAIYYAVVRALDLAGTYIRDRTLTRTLNIIHALTPDFYRTRNLVRDFARDRALDIDPDFMPLVSIYLQANELLVDCLNTDCYVSRDTRQKILDELLTVPESLANSES